MQNNPYTQRIDEQIHSAGPVELVAMLNRSLCQRIGQAREAQRAGDMRGRAAAVSRAIAIVGELAQSLRPEAEPELAGTLRELYAFVVDRLLQGNAQQLDAPLAEAQRVAEVLAEAWRELGDAAMPATVITEAIPAGLSCCG